MKDFKIVDYMQISLDIKPNESKKTCFIVYSSWEPHINNTLDAIETVLESTGKYEIKRLALHGIPGHSQYSQLIDFLNKCSLAIIILDGFRPNVLFEYGILAGLHKPCIVLLEQNAIINIQSFQKTSNKKASNIPIDMDKDFSDVKDQMYVKYNCNELKKLRELLDNELTKIEPFVEETFMKLLFPEKEYLNDDTIKDSLAIFLEMINTDREFNNDDEVKFRVCVNEIEKISRNNGFKLTLYYYYQKLQILIVINKLDEAIKQIDELLIENTFDTQLFLLKSYILNIQDKQELAIKCLNDAIKNDSKNETLWHKKALLLDRLDKTVEAAFCYQKGIEFNEGCANIHYHYGLLLLDDDKFDEALSQFNKALKIKPTDSRYIVCKGICLKKLGNNVAAKKAFIDALSFDENNADAWFQLARLTDNNLEAIQHYDKCLSLNNNHAGALCSKGALLLIGKEEEACLCFNKAITCCEIYNNKGCNIVHENLGSSKYELFRTDNSKTDYALEAIEHFNKFIAYSNDNNQNRKRLNDIGYIYLSLNNISKAREAFNKALEVDIVDNSKLTTIILYNLALTYLLERDVVKAKELLFQSINLSSQIKSSERKCYCLFIPDVNLTEITLTELNIEPDIYECTKIALDVANSLKINC